MLAWGLRNCRLPISDCQLAIGGVACRLQNRQSEIDNSSMGVTRRIVKAGGWKVAKRIIKPIPIIGSVLAFGLAGYEIKKKGLIPGAVHVGLDVTPVIGTAKGVLEIFTGDLIPDKKDRIKNRSGRPPMPTKAK
jgi:hypothetical protein